MVLHGPEMENAVRCALCFRVGLMLLVLGVRRVLPRRGFRQSSCGCHGARRSQTIAATKGSVVRRSQRHGQDSDMERPPESPTSPQ